MTVMSIDLDQLPDSPQALKAMLVEALQKNEQLRAEHNKTLESKQAYITQLEQALRRANAERFGRRSERHAGQGELSLFNEAELLADANPEPEATSVRAHRRRGRGANALPKNLRRVDIVYDLTDEQKQCSNCGNTLRPIGDEVLEQLVMVPAQRFVHRHVRRKYGCSCKGCLRTASMPKQPLPASAASPQLLATVATSKYLDGLPLNRLEKMAKRDGLSLPRAKLARWLIEGAKVLTPVLNLLEDTFFGYDIAASDDTGIQVLKEDGRAPQSKSYLWIRRGGPPHQPVILVDYSPSRSAKTAFRLLEQFRGALICDGYPGFNLSAKQNGLTLVLCNDHARRRFVEVLKSLTGSAKPVIAGSQSTTEALLVNRALEFYRKLYRIETHTKDFEPLARLQHRNLHAVPVWNEFIEWAENALNAGVADKGSREALQYLVKHRHGLRHYCDDGRLPISNIQAEHVAKQIAIARKNFLFSDTPAGAHASARLFSLLLTAVANGHHPQRYLSVLFAELPNIDSVEGYEALLPWNLTVDEVNHRYAAFPAPRIALTQHSINW
jgi:transposase